jgi:TonB family protein
MSSIEPEDQFSSEDELKRLLERWIAPKPSSLLDKRVANSYYREFGRAAAEPVPLPQGKKEVVAMKFCSTCQEEFADKFSFCPVDGTPLNGFALKRKESAIRPVENRPAVLASNEPVLAAVSSKALASRGEYHLTIMEDAGLASRLVRELKDVAHEYELTWPEFKRDPFGFVKRSITGYGQMAGRFFGNRNVVIAMVTAVLAMAALVGAIAFIDRSQSTGTSRTGLIVFALLAFGMLVGIFATWLSGDRGAALAGAQPTDSRNVVFAMMASFVFIFAILGGVVFLDYYQRLHPALAQNSAEQLEVEQIFDIPNEQPTPDPGTAGFNKGSGGGSKPKQERPGGGGGGGRQEQTPASAGKLPQASLTVPQILPPDPKPPVVRNPALPVAASVVADPLLVPPDARVLPYGDPKSKSTTPSSGPGTGNGIGNGTGTGVGPGEGGGVGPGRGGNIGGGDYHEGGGGPGGGGYGGIFSGKDVSQKARVLSKPEPTYTEEARKNQITGTVVLRAVFTSSGQVSNIRAVSGLPYGLTERAIAAARLIKFLPATKDGHPVSMYIQLEYNFNLY